MMLLAVFLSFVVVDGEGRPVEGAAVGHTKEQITVVRTGKDGRVALETDALRVVIRKERYQAVVVKPREMMAGGRVVLRGAGPVGACSPLFPAPGWKARGPRSQGLDGVLHGSGPNWGSLVLSTKRVWASETYAEREIVLNGWRSVDARGVMPDGTHWRAMGNLGESISYEDVSAEKAAELDRAIEKLCQPRFSARVVDGDGRPMEGVTVWADGGTAVTGADGQVRGATNGLWIAFRKLEYQAVIVKPAEGLAIVMQRAQAAPFPRCKEGQGTTFQLPPADGGTPFHDVDYNGRSYMVQTGSGKHYLRHGYGPTWSFGYPLAQFLQQSKSYAESTFALRADITAARGEFADGTRWRFLGTIGETISYETKDAEAALRFDALMDGVCLGR